MFAELHFMILIVPKGHHNMPRGIYHVALATYHISKGNISLSRQGKYHWLLRKFLFATPFWVRLLAGHRADKGGLWWFSSLFTVVFQFRLSILEENMYNTRTEVYPGGRKPFC